jgi:uncharacterized membrane protein
VNIVDKKITDVTENTRMAMFLMNITKIPWLFILWIMASPSFALDNRLFLTWAIIAFINVIAVAIYLRVLKNDDVSVVMPIYEITPLWWFILAFFLLHEIPTIFQIGAMFFLMTWALIFAYQPSNSWKINIQSFFTKTLLLVLISSFCYSLLNTLIKYAVADYSIENVFIVYLTLYIIFTGLISIMGVWSTDIKNLSLLSKKLLLFFIIWQWIGIVAHLYYVRAFTDGMVSLASAITSTQSLFVMMLSLLLSYFLPSFLKEKWDIKSIIQKIIGTLVIMLGIVFIYMWS